MPEVGVNWTGGCTRRQNHKTVADEHIVDVLRAGDSRGVEHIDDKLHGDVEDTIRR